MKKYVSLLTAMAILLSLCACGSGGAEKEYDPASTASALLDSGAFSETLEPLDADLVAPLYGLDTQPTDSAVYTSTGATTEEIAVLKFGDKKAADAALEALKNRVSDQKDACQGYLPKELPKLDKAIVKESGNSVLLVVAADMDKAQSALDGLA